jgi:hypothetical protein
LSIVANEGFILWFDNAQQDAYPYYKVDSKTFEVTDTLAQKILSVVRYLLIACYSHLEHRFKELYHSYNENSPQICKVLNSSSGFHVLPMERTGWTQSAFAFHSEPDTETPEVLSCEILPLAEITMVDLASRASRP